MRSSEQGTSSFLAACRDRDLALATKTDEIASHASSLPPRTMRSVYALALLVAFATPTLAFFEQFFHQGQAPPPPPAFNFEAQRDSST